MSQPKTQTTKIDWQEVIDAIAKSLSNAEGQLNAAHLEDEFMKAGLGVYRMPDEPPVILKKTSNGKTKEGHGYADGC